MTPAEYRAKAALVLERANATGPDGNPELVAIALKYLCLADLAEKNTGTDVVYETPPTVMTLPMQQQPEVEPQTQQAAKQDPSEQQVPSPQVPFEDEGGPF